MEFGVDRRSLKVSGNSHPSLDSKRVQKEMLCALTCVLETTPGLVRKGSGCFCSVRIALHDAFI